MLWYCIPSLLTKLWPLIDSCQITCFKTETCKSSSYNEQLCNDTSEFLDYYSFQTLHIMLFMLWARASKETYHAHSFSFIVCSDWSVYTRLSQHWTLYLRSALLRFQLQVSFNSSVNIGINCSNVWHGDLVGCHKVTVIQVGLLTRCFRLFRKCFLWEEGTSVIADFGLFSFQDLLDAKESIKHN